MSLFPPGKALSHKESCLIRFYAALGFDGTIASKIRSKGSLVISVAEHPTNIEPLFFLAANAQKGEDIISARVFGKTSSGRALHKDQSPFEIDLTRLPNPNDRSGMARDLQKKLAQSYATPEPSTS